ncbi:type VI secretion system contractile sheath small subunit [Taibaiella sp. KBW10]|uniref:type VI secretion system contractile sheath small subunit n=1 Tax=Taibaiella sp. KBW10 TaxID=2153357 RepID=UPI0018F64989|nr:type VI secretion system contractile sheath small subunit [Taibaiella sp. KBW10]
MRFWDKLIRYFSGLFNKPETAQPDGAKETVNDLDNSNNNNISHHKIKTTTMAMYNYGVGGNEVKVDANEAIQDIQENKTLLVSKLTTDEPFVPEVVTGLKTVEDVFKRFQPAISVEHESEDGTTVSEEFRFKNLGDFTPKNMTQNSEYLSNLSLEEEQFNKIIRQLRNNKVLRNVLADGGSKEALIQALKAVAAELEQNG